MAKFKNQQLHSFTPTRKAAVDLKRVTTLKPLFSKLASSSSSSTTTTTTITGSDLGDRLPMMDSFTATTYQLQQLQENNKNFDDDFDDEALDLVLEETKAEILLQHGKLTLGQELAAGGMSPPDFLESASSLKKAGSSFHDKEKSNGFSSPLKKVTFGFTNNHTSNLDNSLFKVNQVSLSSSKPEASGNTVSQHYNHEDISLSEISKKDLEESIDLMNSSCNDLDNMNSSYVEDNGLFSKNDNQEQVFNMSLISNLTLPEDFHLSQLPEMDLEEIWKTGDFASKMLFDEEGDDENNEMQDKEEDDANTKSSGAGNSKNNSGLGSSTSDTSQLQKQFIGLFAGSRRVGGGEEDNNEDDDGEHWLNSVAHSNDPDSSSISDVLYMGLRHRIKEIKAEVLRKKIEATQSM